MRNPALTRVLALACLAGLTLTACNSEVAAPAAPSPPDTADADAGALAAGDTDPPPAPNTAPEPTVEAAARSFICDNGHWVELVGDDTARVTLADGRTIEISRKPGGVAEYRGVALSFDLDDDGQGGVLGQDEVGGFNCRAAG